MTYRLPNSSGLLLTGERTALVTACILFLHTHSKCVFMCAFYLWQSKLCACVAPFILKLIIHAVIDAYGQFALELPSMILECGRKPEDLQITARVQQVH